MLRKQEQQNARLGRICMSARHLRKPRFSKRSSCISRLRGGDGRTPQHGAPGRGSRHLRSLLRTPDRARRRQGRIVGIYRIPTGRAPPAGWRLLLRRTSSTLTRLQHLRNSIVETRSCIEFLITATAR